MRSRRMPGSTTRRRSTLNMASSLKTALSDLGSVENLDTLRSEMVRSWTDLMKIVDEVNDGLRLQPGM